MTKQERQNGAFMYANSEPTIPIQPNGAQPVKMQATTMKTHLKKPSIQSDPHIAQQMKAAIARTIRATRMIQSITVRKSHAIEVEFHAVYVSLETSVIVEIPIIGIHIKFWIDGFCRMVLIY